MVSGTSLEGCHSGAWASLEGSATPPHMNVASLEGRHSVREASLEGLSRHPHFARVE